MSTRKVKPPRKPTALDVLVALDDVVEPFTTYAAHFGKEIDGTCFFSTSEFEGRGKTFSEALVNWSTGRLAHECERVAKEQSTKAQVKSAMEFISCITGVPVKYLMGEEPAKAPKRKAKPARKRR